jgi:Sulfotransferase family
MRTINFGRLVRNYGWGLPAHLWLEGRTRLYEHEPVRACVRIFFPAKAPDLWVFPIGCYNSGTTILQELLATHPEISTLPKEGVRFTAMLPSPEDKGWVRMWVRCAVYMDIGSEIEPQRAERIRDDWAPWLDHSCRVFMDKSVSNVTRIHWLDRNFDNPYFIAIVRDGYCVAEGIRRKARPRGEAARQIGNVYPIEMAGEQWSAANERLVEAANTVGRFMMIKYEDLVNDPVNIMGKLWTFLGLDLPHMEALPDGLIIGQNVYHIEQNNNAQSYARLSVDDIRRLSPIIRDMQERLGYPVRD